VIIWSYIFPREVLNHEVSYSFVTLTDCVAIKIAQSSTDYLDKWLSYSTTYV